MWDSWLCTHINCIVYLTRRVSRSHYEPRLGIFKNLPHCSPRCLHVSLFLRKKKSKSQCTNAKLWRIKFNSYLTELGERGRVLEHVFDNYIHCTLRISELRVFERFWFGLSIRDCLSRHRNLNCEFADAPRHASTDSFCLQCDVGVIFAWIVACAVYTCAIASRMSIWRKATVFMAGTVTDWCEVRMRLLLKNVILLPMQSMFF